MAQEWNFNPITGERIKTKSSRKKRKQKSQEENIFVNVTNPRIINNLDFHQEYRRKLMNDLLRGDKGSASYRARKRSFDNETKRQQGQIKNGISWTKFKVKPKTKKQGKKKYQPLDGSAFKPEDWENIKKGASFLGRSARKGTKSAFEFGRKQKENWENRDINRAEGAFRKRKEQRDKAFEDMDRIKKTGEYEGKERQAEKDIKKYKDSAWLEMKKNEFAREYGYRPNEGKEGEGFLITSQSDPKWEKFIKDSKEKENQGWKSKWKSKTTNFFR